MPLWKRNVLVLWFGVFFVSSSFSMVVPFLPLFLLQLGVKNHTEIWSGAIYSATFLTSAIASPFWGGIADRYGRKPMIIRSGVTLAVAYTLTSFVTNPYQILLLRLLQGFLTGFIPSSIALVGTNTPKEKVGYSLSLISTASASGGIVGPLIGGTIAQLVGNRMAFASAGVITLLSTLLVILLVKENHFSPSKEKSTVKKDLRNAWNNKNLRLVLFMTFLANFSIMIIEPIFPLYIAKLEGSSDKTSLLAGIVFSLPGIASALFAPFWGKKSDKVGFRKILLIGLFGGGIGTLFQLFFYHILGFSIIRFIYGCFFCAVFPTLNGLVVKSTKEEFRGRAFSLNQTASQIGGLTGPLIGGVLAGVFPVHSIFLITGILLLLAATFACRYDKNSI